MQSNAAKRSRKMAKPSWDWQEGRAGSDFAELLDEEQFYNETIDFTFNYHYAGTGVWTRKQKQNTIPFKEIE
jgi:hypothetical protein